MNKKNLFICHTYYHVFISVIKALKNNNLNYILLVSSWQYDNLNFDNKIQHRLKDSKIFIDVLVENYNIEEKQRIQKGYFKDIKKLIFLKKMKKNYPINLNNYDEIYLFSDTTPVGRYINICKIKYNLLEDGTDCFINNKNRINSKNGIKKIIKYFFGFKDSGKAKYIKSIEVNDKNGIFLKRKNIIETKKSQMLKELNCNDKKIISNIFLSNINLEKFNNYVLIITQPLFDDKLLKNETEQLKIYNNIIDQYCKNDKVFIKLHPRETTNYEKLNKKCYILKDNFPLELFNFYDNLKFKKIITISSTSINVLNNSNDKIILGWEWLENEKSKLKY